MTKYIYTILIVGCMTIFSHLHAQSADIESGCIPLTVQFTAPSAASYFWDFDDGASSDIQNPNHAFIDAGEYTVSLYTAQGGTLIGDLTIKVYPDILIEIESDLQMGCLPLQVNFTSTVTKDDDITIDSYLWAFGDGGSSSEENPTYTYNTEGVFPVSLKITSSIGECDKTELVSEPITVTGVKSKFVSNKFSSCEAPDVFIFTNTTTQVAGNTYFWDFGDGQTFDDYQPENITYTENGLYEISLTVTSASGCVSVSKRNINIGPPFISFDFDSVACIRSNSFFKNNTIADAHMWDFGNNPNLEVLGENTASPIVYFPDYGEYEVNYSAVSLLGCTADTSFTMYVNEVNPNFSIGPSVTCTEEFTIILEAQDLEHQQYTWLRFNEDGSDLTSTSPSLTEEFVHPERDSFYVNYPDSLIYNLSVTSQYGCIDSLEKVFVLRKPEAFFIPDEVIGLSPLTVTFADLSYSAEPIVLRDWDFGNGTTESSTTLVNPVVTYDQPGEYWVRLTITNDAGCIDPTELIKITVLDVTDFIAEGMGKCTANGMTGDFEICVGDSVEVIFDNPYPDLIDFHFNSDNGRFNHCWTNDQGTHTFLYPGEYEMEFTLEYEGFIFFTENIGTLTVTGAHSKLDFETDCSDIYNVDFQSKSINADNFQWYIDGLMVSDQETFVHNFTTKGRHAVELRASNSGSQCAQHIDTSSVYITEIKADFEVPQNMCDSVFYVLNASASIDVHDPCHEGYLWNFDHHRPREVGRDTLSQQFPAGRQEITLITEDINGCKDSLTKWVNVYGRTPDFPIDSTICLPYNTDFIDATISDTTIVEWDWSFGSTEQNPNFTFPDNPNDVLGVELVVTDAIGCKDSIYKEYFIYNLSSQINFNRGPNICIGSSIEFSATDYNEQGSFLNWNWDFGPYGTSQEPNPEIFFTESGSTEVTLTYQEESSGCTGDTTIIVEAVDVPIAAFSTSVDSLDVICHPETIEFYDESITSGNIFMAWDFGNGVSSQLTNPAISYDKGIFTTRMIVRSIFGCADTLYQTFELVGPEGEALVDKTSICIGEEITLSIIDTSEVNSFTWDFGDGITIDNQSPVTHAYTIPSDETNVNLILKSTDSGCELIRTIPITLGDVFADFELLEQEGFCNGTFSIENLSKGATNYEWTFNDQTSSSTDPVFDFSEPGLISVSLQVSDDQTACSHTAVKELNILGTNADSSMPNIFSPNDDNINDYFNPVTDDPTNQEFIEVVEFKIYNRWGKLIYDNDDPVNGWNGIYQNVPVPLEVYSYFVEYNINGCNTKSTKGNVTVIR